MPKSTGAVAVLLCILAATAAAQADLTPLFAPSTQAERDAVAADWAGRAPTPTEWTVERTGTAGGHVIDAVSHKIDGFTHYGAIRYPLDWQPGGKFPVLVLLHGGFDGLTLDYLLTFDADLPGGAVRDSFLVVAPTYRSEALNLEPIIGFRYSGGAPSPFDRDCDDTIALLTAVLLNTPEADSGYVVALGGSRGGNVAYHLAARDSRIRRTVIRYGPTDFFLPHVQTGAQEKTDTGFTDDALGDHVADSIVAPWLAGDLTLAEARALLIGWSPTEWLVTSEPYQIHHGAYDTTVPILHSERVDTLMTSRGATAPDFAYFAYPLGSHNAGSLDGFGPRAEEYLTGLATLTSVGALPAAPPPLRGTPNPFQGATELSVARTDKSDDVPVVDIFDLRGHVVRTLALSSGPDRWTRRWDGRDAVGRDVSAGVYFAAVRGLQPVPPLKLLRLR